MRKSWYTCFWTHSVALWWHRFPIRLIEYSLTQGVSVVSNIRSMFLLYIIPIIFSRVASCGILVSFPSVLARWNYLSAWFHRGWCVLTLLHSTFESMYLATLLWFFATLVQCMKFVWLFYCSVKWSLRWSKLYLNVYSQCVITLVTVQSPYPRDIPPLSCYYSPSRW